MARILLAWELGDGFGHVSRMLTIAEELRDRGHDCVFVVRNLEVVAARVQAAGFDVLPAPTQAIRYAASNGHPPTSVGDILAFIGFAEVERLRPFIKNLDQLGVPLGTGCGDFGLRANRSFGDWRRVSHDCYRRRLHAPPRDRWPISQVSQ